MKRPETAPDPQGLQRVIADFGEPRLGPTLIVIAGLHGNEPAGIHAVQRVRRALEGPPFTAALEAGQPSDATAPSSTGSPTARLAGRFVALAGNLPALRQGRRYLDRDLNRIWHPHRVRQLAAGDEPMDAEERELVALKGLIDGALGEAAARAFMIDMHSTSSKSAPFILFADTLRNRAFARQFPLPLVLGLEEQVDGALLDLYDGGGVVTMGVEGGQHEDPAAVDHLESVLWLSLVSAGLLSEAQVVDLTGHRRRLRRARGGVPSVLEVRFRHAIARGDDFRMEPGFKNFQPVRKGQLLAHDHQGAIAARESGRILMPLYQGQGEDGYFLTRAVQPFWLRISAFLRRRRLGVLLPFLPGVRPDPSQAGTLVIDTSIARVLPLQALHLLGYRKQRWVGNQLVVSRRHKDLVTWR